MQGTLGRSDTTRLSFPPCNSYDQRGKTPGREESTGLGLQGHKGDSQMPQSPGQCLQLHHHPHFLEGWEAQCDRKGKDLANYKVRTALRN